MEKVILMSEMEFNELTYRFEKQLTELKKQLKNSQEENRSLKEQRAYLLRKINKLEE